MKGDFSRLDFLERGRKYYGVLDQQGRVKTDAENNERLAIQRHHDETTRRHVIGRCGAPQENPGFSVRPFALGDVNSLRIGAGCFYVEGMLLENDTSVLIENQPFFSGFTLPRNEEEDNGFYVAYLDVWQRHITALEDPSIREVALGGPDTTTRLETVWQVFLERVASLDDQTPTCDQFDPDWRPAGVSATLPRLNARAVPPVEDDNLCIVPAQAGYRRLDNDLYRVEIHTSNPATFKWARDNASRVTRLNLIDGLTLSVADPGRDKTLGFAVGQWVEVTDAGRELRGEPGVLVELTTVNGTELTITAWPDGAPPELELQEATVRTWDSLGALPVAAGDEWTRLVDWKNAEDGIEVNIHSEGCRTGDYWTIPGRTALGDIVWPHDAVDEPLAETRHGIVHHYCPLTLLRKEGDQWDIVTDCRRLFPALTALPTGEDDAERLRITNVLLRANDNRVRNGRQVTGADLASGLEIVFNDSIAPRTARSTTIYVELYIPYPVVPQDIEFWNSETFFGRMPVVLDAQVIPAPTGTSVRWHPRGRAVPLLRTGLFERLGENAVVPAKLCIDGKFIWAENDPNRLLDATNFGSPALDEHHIDLVLPSGDGRRGGVFELWMSVVRQINVNLHPLGLDLVNPNTADEDELGELLGIGGSLVSVIVDNRPFERREDLENLLRISGMSEATLRRLRERITL